MSPAPRMSGAVDACVYLGRCRYGGELAVAQALTRAGELGVATLVGVAAAPTDRDLAAATTRLLDAAREPAGPVRLAVLARIDPWEPDALAAAESALARGAVGVFLHPWEETFRVNDHRLLGPLLELLAAADRPLVVEAGYPWRCEPAQLADLADHHPGVRVVGTRGGHLNMSGLSGQTALRALHRAPNLHLTTSGVYRQDWLADVVEQLGAGRLCYASLAPVLEPRLELLRPAALARAADRAQVLRGTATRLFGLDRPGPPSPAGPPG